MKESTLLASTPVTPSDPRARFFGDPHFPAYHFLSGDWMNDPKLFFHNGEYHVYFQYTPGTAVGGLKYWGHTVSTDLVHWKLLPVALAPAPDSPDADGCWTGCVVEDAGVFKILYTGIPHERPFRQVQCLATSEDLIHWEKYPDNPVIAEKPDGFGECFRDPCAWQEDGAWWMLIGSELPEREGGAALLYRSPDLISWEYLHPLCVGKTEETGFEFECPDFFPLGDRHALLTSLGQTYWHIGEYRDQRFHRDRYGVTDSGHFYAAKTLVDDRGRRILWGWVTEGRSQEGYAKAGWSGVLSLPRELTLLEDGSLGIQPVAELETLRGRKQAFEGFRLSSEENGGFRLLEGIHGDALEVVVTFRRAEAEAFGVKMRCSPDGEEAVTVSYTSSTQQFVKSPLALQTGEPLVMRIFVDRSVIESFANGRACHTFRTYPEREDCLGVGLFVQSGQVEVESVEVWELHE
jgi:beta-fructofuranosidase